MLDFYLKVVIYLVMFVVSFYGLSALDFNRFLKRNSSANATILYILIALIMANSIFVDKFEREYGFSIKEDAGDSSRALLKVVLSAFAVR